jgi:hypothetical protein
MPYVCTSVALAGIGITAHRSRSFQVMPIKYSWTWNHRHTRPGIPLLAASEWSTVTQQLPSVMGFRPQLGKRFLNVPNSC